MNRLSRLPIEKRFKSKHLWLTAIAVVCALVILVVRKSPGRLSSFDAGVAGDGNLELVLNRILDDDGPPSLATVLLHNGQIVEMGAVGVRAEGYPEQVTTGDRWHLGSIGKSLTATLAAILIEEGVIEWDTTIVKVFPELNNSIHSRYKDIGLEELLAHTSGLPADERQIGTFTTDPPNVGELQEQRKIWVAELLTLPPESPRGTFRYGNANYIVAAAMLEASTGKSWEEMMTTKVFAPLEMFSTGFGAPGSVGEEVDEPRGHVRKQDRYWPLQPDHKADNPAAVGPAGNIHSTLSDAASYMAAHLIGTRTDNGIVSRENFLKLQSEHAGTAYSMGWNLRTHSHSGGRILYHHGSNGVWHATMWIAPAREFAILTVTNAGDAAAVRSNDQVLRAMIDRVNAASK